MSGKKVSAGLEFGLDILEYLKTREVTRADLAAHFEVTEATIWRSLHPLVLRGFVRERTAATAQAGGRWKFHYATKAWGGFQ